MAYFWRCPVCGRLYTFDDDEPAGCPRHGWSEGEDEGSE